MRTSLLIFGFFSLLPFETRVSVADSNISSVSVTGSQTNATLDSDSLDSRVTLAALETVNVVVQWTDVSGTVTLVAPHGGKINGGGGHSSIQAGNGTISFSFQPGTTPGAYTIEMTAGSETKTVGFWIGSQPPRGVPGPNLTFPAN